MNHHTSDRAVTILLRLSLLAFCLLPSRALAVQTVRLAWDRNIETNVVTYKLYYGTASRTYSTALNVGNVLTSSVPNLVEGTTYYFAVTALNSVGAESDFSTEIAHSIPAATTNRPPTLNAIVNLTINEDSGIRTVQLSGITSGALEEVQTLTVTAASGNTGLVPNPTVTYTSPNSTGSLTFTPASNASGSATITVTVSDGQAQTVRSFVVTVDAVNDPPTLASISARTINEDAPTQTVSLSGITSGAPNETQTLTVTAASSNAGLIPSPTVTYASPNSTGSLTFTPASNASGSATITVTVSDGQAQTNRSFLVTVNAANDPPTLSPVAAQTIDEDAATQSIPLSGISSGASNEVQTLSLTATSSNPALVPTPTISYTSPNSTGSLTFTPLGNAFGSATITVTASDGQAQTNRSFVVTVNPVNDPPALANIADQTVSGEAMHTVQLSGISSGASNEIQTISVAATSSNPALIPNPTVTYISPNSTGSLSFTPLSNVSGSATITVTVSDSQAQTNRAFIVTLNSVNNPPTLSSIAPLTIDEDAAMQTVQLSGITAGASNEVQTISVTAVSSNPALIPDPTVTYTSPNSTGSLNFTPLSNASGSATITVTVTDGQAQTNRSFVVTINPVNDPPTLASIAGQTTSEDAGTQTIPLSGISSGASNELQTLSVTAASSNPSLISDPTITYTSPNSTGSLSFTPNGRGSVTLTVTVSDGQAQTNRSFVVTIRAANQPPTLSNIAPQTIEEDAGMQTVQLSGITSGASNEVQTISVTAASSNPALIPNPTVTYTSPNSTGNLTFTPLSNAYGSATITVTVSDGQGQTNRSFVVTVNPVNDPPTLATIADQTISEDAAMQTVQLSGITSGASNEVQTISVTVTSSNPALISNPTVTHTSPGSTGSLTFTPLTNASGSATITVTVSDGQTQTERSFVVTVNPVNDLPTLSSIPAQTISHNTVTALLPFTIGDAETAASNLTVTAVSSNLTLVPAANIVLDGSDSNRTVRIAPATNQFGVATIEIFVSDGASSNSTTFLLTVTNLNSAPLISTIPDQKLIQNQRSTPVPFTVYDPETPAEVLALSATSSDTRLVPLAGIELGGASSNRTVTISPASGRTGTATITLIAADGLMSSARSFQVKVARQPKVRSLSSEATGGFTIDWESDPGMAYRILCTTNLNQPTWIVISEKIMAIGPTTLWTDRAATPDASRFYTVEILPSE